MRVKLKLFSAVLMVSGWAALCAQTPSAGSPLPPPVNHDFDFWLGDWNVVTPDGKPAGTNRIESVSGGRGLYENWSGATQPNGQPGGNGKSLNTYNAAKKQWQQFWVGSGGGVLELAGGLVDGKMVLSGSRALAAGGTLTNRITWAPNPDGTVRQHWEQSRDDGKTWTTAFDGLYKKLPPEK